MISNPIKTGHGKSEESFTYEPRPVLYHFCPYDQGLSKYLSMNVVFFAGDQEEADATLVKMLNFAIGHLSKSSKLRAEYILYRDTIEEGKACAHLAPMDQFYRVGWADNDTLL